MLRLLSSVRLTLVGMALLCAGVLLSYNRPAAPLWWLVAPLGLLAVNLLAAIAVNPGINRQGGLLVFHLALLGIVVLAAVGRLVHLDGVVEVTEDSAFLPGDVQVLAKGPLHPMGFSKVFFVQGPFTVDYGPELSRSTTRSQVLAPDGAGRLVPVVVGDDHPLILYGYRFYTSSNKGFAPLLTWIPEHGKPVTGAIHMPSYPLFDWKQDNRWTPPGGAEIRFWLRLKTPLRADAAWTLDRKDSSGVLIVSSGGRRIELKPGQTARLEGGSLRFDELRTWMGYKIFYDPTLPWLFVVAVAGVGGLAWHFWRRLGSSGPERTGRAAGFSAGHGALHT